MIDFYSTGCPQCNILKKKLDSKNIEYNLITDIDIINNKAREMKILSVPFLIIDNELYNFSNAVRWINEH